MICSYCRQEFSDEEAAVGCQGCGAFGGCHLIKCPHCDYEQPLEPGWIKKVRGWLRKDKMNVIKAEESH